MRAAILFALAISGCGTAPVMAERPATLHTIVQPARVIMVPERTNDQADAPPAPRRCRLPPVPAYTDGDRALGAVPVLDRQARLREGRIARDAWARKAIATVKACNKEAQP